MEEIDKFAELLTAATVHFISLEYVCSSKAVFGIVYKGLQYQPNSTAYVYILNILGHGFRTPNWPES